jgi:hypothetical protein
MGATVTLKESFKAIKENLQAAAAIIRERGWCQNQGSDADGGCCLARALGEAERATGATGEFVLAAMSCMHIRSLGIKDAIKWNDTPGRTKEEVLELLERAAETAE